MAQAGKEERPPSDQELIVFNNAATDCRSLSGLDAEALASFNAETAEACGHLSIATAAKPCRNPRHLQHHVLVQRVALQALRQHLRKWMFPCSTSFLVFMLQYPLEDSSRFICTCRTTLACAKLNY